jgi:NADP-dependent 3-hydroxy acid dehydrogenase YdfG
MDSYVRGRSALISGGASGIGAAMAKLLTALGADVTIADRQLELAQKVAGELGATAVELDVRDADAWKRAVEGVVARRGRIDLFFNNAGIAMGGEMGSYSQKDWDDVVDVNLKGVIYGVHTVYPLMVAQKSGHIINTASMAGLLSSVAQAPYTATKHAVVGLSKGLRIEARDHGVRVSVLCPGVVRTPILSGGRYGRPLLPGVSVEESRKMWEQLRPLDPDVFARKALKAVAADKAIIVLPRFWKLAWYIERLSPWLMMKLGEIGIRDLRKRLAKMAKGGADGTAAQ